MDASERVFAELRTYLTTGRPDLELLSYYRGVPFVYKAMAWRIREGQIIFAVQPPALALLKPNEKAILLCESLLDPIQAKVVALDLRAGLVEMGDFSYASSKASSRREMRIEPETYYDVELARGDFVLKGMICDISMSGIGVIVNDVEHFAQSDILRLAIHLPTGVGRMRGKIVKVTKSGADYRLAVEFTGVPIEKIPIIRYIIELREKIRVEVHNMYAAAVSRAQPL